MNKIFLSVVIPCYDEMANLQKGVLDKVEHFLEKNKYNYEVIIADDGSGDGSVEFIEKFVKDSPNFKLLKNSHLGKAGAVTTGILEAKGECILFVDMDQATPIEEVEKLLPYFKKEKGNFDIVIGSRSTNRKGSPLTRLIISRAAIVLRKLIIGINEISDTQCGFKAFKHDVAKKLFVRIKDLHEGFSKISGSAVTAGFDMELIYLAKKMNYKIKEVPVEWLYVETRRVSPIKDSVDGLLDLFRIKIKDLKGKYR